MNNDLEKVDYKRKTTLYKLEQLWERFLKESDFDSDLKSYFLKFIDEKTIKERIILDKLNYFLIKENQDYSGFFEYIIQEKQIIISKFCIFKKYINQKNYKSIFKNILDLFKEKDEIILYIISDSKEEIGILESLGFENIDLKTKYIGENFFVRKNKLKKIL